MAKSPSLLSSSSSSVRFQSLDDNLEWQLDFDETSKHEIFRWKRCNADSDQVFAVCGLAENLSFIPRCLQTVTLRSVDVSLLEEMPSKERRQEFFQNHEFFVVADVQGGKDVVISDSVDGICLNQAYAEFLADEQVHSSLSDEQVHPSLDKLIVAQKFGVEGSGVITSYQMINGKPWIWICR